MRPLPLLMDPKTLDLASEFCSLVGKPNLLAYLGLPEDASPEAAQKKLKARRKYMQGMQSNPKYKAEAIFLIKNFGALSRVLENPIPYLQDARMRAESQHLPVLEMTIKGVLAGGTLTHEQEDYLRRNALELGVSEGTFEEVLDRLCGEADVKRATAALVVSDEELQSSDFYQLLGVPRHASRDEIYTRYRARKEEAKSIADPGERERLRVSVEKAWKVLSDESRRQQYDLSWTRTGPPARNREVSRPVQVATAPPVRNREMDPSHPPGQPVSLLPARMEVLSERRQTVPIQGAPVTISIEVRNGGEKPLRGTVRSDQAWLRVLTPSLQPELKQQSVRVQIDPQSLDGRSGTGVVTLVSESGETATIELQVVTTSRPYAMVFAGGAAAGLVVLLLIGLVAMMSGSSDHAIEIDPWAAEILIDGKRVGAGAGVVIDSPPSGESTITVRHPNFKPRVKDVQLTPGKSTRIELELSAPMDVVPSSDLKRAHLDEAVVVEVMDHFRPRLDRCLRSGLTDSSIQGLLRIHVGKDGLPNGLEIEGEGVQSPAIVDCLKTQAAGPIFPPLTDGDFATVRYDYIIQP